MFSICSTAARVVRWEWTWEFASNTSKPPVPSRVFLERFKKLRLPKVGPERRGHDQFSVGDLPKEKVVVSFFAVGGKEGAGVGFFFGVEVRGKPSPVVFGGVVFAFFALPRDAAARPHNFGAPAVAEREHE